MRTWFCTYEELASDGGPSFKFQKHNLFLKNWSIRKCMSSAFYPQSNGHAELAVKTAKHLLADNTDNYSCLCHDHAGWALLTHCNTPVQDLGMSPAIMLYGQIIKDHLLVLWDKYQPQKQWKEIREVMMAKRWNEQFYNKHCRPLRELQIGNFVEIQNQDGHYHHQWTKMGRVMESCGNRHHQVRVDGSSRVTLCNHRFLHKIYPVVDGPKCYKTLDSPSNSKSPWQQLPEEAMDTKRDVNVALPNTNLR